MPLPFSKSQIEKLGVRLIAEDLPTIDDLSMLHALLVHYDSVLETAVMAIKDELDLEPTSRVKNTGTILEKLRRHGGSWLKSIQDIAGLRIVGEWTRSGQNDVVAKIVQLFSVENCRSPRVVDRRLNPVNGYRAVHIVVYVDSTPVEVQVRTVWQHEWADLYEKLADIFGRGIRYGEDPYELTEEAAAARRQVVGHHKEIELCAMIDLVVKAISSQRKLTVNGAIMLADMIDTLEKEVDQGASEAELRDFLMEVENSIAALREHIGELAEQDSLLARVVS